MNAKKSIAGPRTATRVAQAAAIASAAVPTGTTKIAADDLAGVSSKASPAAQVAAATAPASKEAAGILKRSSQFFADPTTIAPKEGFNPRIDFGDLEQLAGTIEEQLKLGVTGGLLLPLRVKRTDPAGELHKSGKLFQIVNGGRRERAINGILIPKGVKFPEGVPVILVPKDQSEVTDILQMFLSNDSKAFTPIEEAASYKKLRDAGMTIAAICKAVRRAQPHVTSMLALLEAAPELQAAIADGSVGKAMAKTIASEAKGDVAKQKELLAAAKDAKGPKGDKAAKAAVADGLRQQKEKRAAKKGKVLKIRALDDAQLSVLGEKMSEAVLRLMKEAGLKEKTDIRAWIAEDENLSVAYAAGALHGLQAAAGVKINLDI